MLSCRVLSTVRVMTLICISSLKFPIVILVYLGEHMYALLLIAVLSFVVLVLQFKSSDSFLFLADFVLNFDTPKYLRI